MTAKQPRVLMDSEEVPKNLDLVGRVSYCGVIQPNTSDRSTIRAVKDRFTKSANDLRASYVVVTSMRIEPGQVVAYGDAYR